MLGRLVVEQARLLLKGNRLLRSNSPLKVRLNRKDSLNKRWMKASNQRPHLIVKLVVNTHRGPLLPPKDTRVSSIA